MWSFDRHEDGDEVDEVEGCDSLCVEMTLWAVVKVSFFEDSEEWLESMYVVEV